jgi:hypothetical protein
MASTIARSAEQEAIRSDRRHFSSIPNDRTCEPLQRGEIQAASCYVGARDRSGTAVRRAHAVPPTRAGGRAILRSRKYTRARIRPPVAAQYPPKGLPAEAAGARMSCVGRKWHAGLVVVALVTGGSRASSAMNDPDASLAGEGGDACARAACPVAEPAVGDACDPRPPRASTGKIRATSAIASTRACRVTSRSRPFRSTRLRICPMPAGARPRWPRAVLRRWRRSRSGPPARRTSDVRTSTANARVSPGTTPARARGRARPPTSSATATRHAPSSAPISALRVRRNLDFVFTTSIAPSSRALAVSGSGTTASALSCRTCCRPRSTRAPRGEPTAATSRPWPARPVATIRGWWERAPQAARARRVAAAGAAAASPAGSQAPSPARACSSASHS